MTCVVYLLWAMLVCPAPLHLLHHDFVVSQHQGEKLSQFLPGQFTDKTGVRGIQGGDTIPVTQPVGQEAADHFSGFSFVDFHDTHPEVYSHCVELR